MSIEYRDPIEWDSSSRKTAGSTRKRRSRKGRYLSQERPSKRRPRRFNPGFLVFIAVLLIAFFCVALGIRSFMQPTLRGRWDLDGTTVYEFNKGGKGALVLTNKEYEFTYEVNDDQLLIDFVDEVARDAQYTFAVSDGMLFLSGGPGDTKGEYILRKLDR